MTQEERFHGVDITNTRDDRDNMMAMKVQVDLREKSKVFDNSEKIYAHCNRDGHDESSCFQLHGFPDWWGDRPQSGRGPGRGGKSNGRGSLQGGRGKGGGATGAGWKTAGQS